MKKSAIPQHDLNSAQEELEKALKAFHCDVTRPHWSFVDESALCTHYKSEFYYVESVRNALLKSDVLEKNQKDSSNKNKNDDSVSWFAAKIRSVLPNGNNDNRNSETENEKLYWVTCNNKLTWRPSCVACITVSSSGTKTGLLAWSVRKDLYNSDTKEGYSRKVPKLFAAWVELEMKRISEYHKTSFFVSEAIKTVALAEQESPMLITHSPFDKNRTNPTSSPSRNNNKNIEREESRDFSLRKGKKDILKSAMKDFTQIDPETLATYKRLKKDSKISLSPPLLANGFLIESGTSAFFSKSNTEGNSNDIPTLFIKMRVRYINGLDKDTIEKRPRLHLDISKKNSPDLFTKELALGDWNIFEAKYRSYLPYIHPLTRLNFRVYTDVISPEEPIWCGNQAGLLSIPFFEVWQAISPPPESGKSPSPFHVKRDLIIPAGNGVKKGGLEILIETGAVSTKNGLKIYSPDEINETVRVVPTRSFEDGSYKTEDFNNAINSAIRDYWTTFLVLPHSWSNISDVHAYYYDSQTSYKGDYSSSSSTLSASSVGLSLYKSLRKVSGQRGLEKGKIPACLYDIPKTSPAKEEYYRNILSCVLKRRGLSDSVGSLRNMSPQSLGELFIECATVYSNYCKYITDLYQPSPQERNNNTRNKKHNGSNLYEEGASPNTTYQLVESFDCIRIRGVEENRYKVQKDPKDAGDCEDFTKEMLNFVYEFREASFKSEELKTIQENLKLWVFAAVLGSVGAMKLDGYIEGASLNAHEFMVAVPRYLFFDWVSEGVSAEETLDREIEKQGKKLSKARFSQRHLAESLKASGSPPWMYDTESGRRDGLRVIFAEGTGLLDPVPKPEDDSLDKIKDYMVKGYEENFKNFRKRYNYEHGVENSFYKTVTSLFVYEFARMKVPFVEFTAIYPSGPQNNSPLPTVGVRYEHFAAVIPNSSKPSPVYYKPPASSKSRNSNNVPQKIVLLAQPTLSEETIKVCNLVLKDQCPTPVMLPPSENLLKEFASHPLSTHSVSSPPSLPHLTIDSFVRIDQLDDVTLKGFFKCLKKKKITYQAFPEVITAHGVGGFFIKFYVPDDFSKIDQSLKYYY